MDYESIEHEVEKAIMWVYGAMFSTRSHDKDDLLQEARVTIWNEMRKTEVEKDQFIHFLPKLACQGMVGFIRKRYHTWTKSGYLECTAESIKGDVCPLWHSKDHTLEERLLFNDIHKVVTNRSQNPKEYYCLGVYLYCGYGPEEIGKHWNQDRGNIHRKSRRLGRYLLEGWVS